MGAAGVLRLAVPMQVAAAINLVFDIATAKVHSDGHAIARNGAADGSEGPQAR